LKLDPTASELFNGLFLSGFNIVHNDVFRSEKFGGNIDKLVHNIQGNIGNTVGVAV
jgi:hypothetical protein